MERNDFLTEITFSDFKEIIKDFKIRSTWDNNYKGERNLLNYIIENEFNNLIELESNKILVALHTNFENECYLDKYLGDKNYILIDNVDKVLRNRDYWLVYQHEIYQIPRKQTQAIYLVHLDK